MNKKTAAILFAVILMLAPKSLFAEDAVSKLSRGIVNIVTSPVEYLVQYNISAEDHNPLVGLLSGIFYGTGFTVARIVSGAYDIVTFPFPLPKDYAPLMKPDTGIEALQALHGQAA